MTKRLILTVSLAIGAAIAQIAVNGSRTFIGNLRVRYPNAAATGTVLNRLAKLTGSPATAVRNGTGDTNEAVGIVVDGAGSSGNAEIAFTGKAFCEFDGATTAGNYVQISATLAGACHDSGSAALPASGQVIGRVTATNASAGVYEVDLTARTNYPAPPTLTTITGSLRVIYANASTTGTTLNRLAKLTGAPSMAVITATSDTTGAVGIVAAGAGTTGSADIAFTGKASCVFDGATTAGHYVQISATTAGDCHDAGATLPASGQIIGIVTTTNGGAGTNEVDLTFKQTSAVGGGGGTGTVTSSGTPLIHQMPVWTTATDLTGIAAGATDKPLVGVTGGDPAFSKMTLTNPATAATLTISDNKSLTVNNSMTLAGTDGQTYTLPSTSATIARTDAANSFTGVQSMVSPALTTPVISTDLHCATAGGCTLGSAALPASGLYIGNAATNNIHLSGTSAAARAVTIPDVGTDTGATVALSPTSTTPTQVLHATATAGLYTPAAIAVADLPALTDVSTVAYSVTPTFTVVSGAKLQTFKITLTGNVTSLTLTTTAAAVGQDISFIICQDGTGSRTWPSPWASNITDGGPIDPTASVCTKQMFRWDGTNAIAVGPAKSDSATPGIRTSAGLLSLPTAPDILVAKASTDTFTNKTLDAEGTGNVLTIPVKVWLPAAGCQNTTASLFWDTPTTNPAVAACVTGTNTQKGVADFADGSTSLSMQISIALPSDWTGMIDAKFKWLTTATTGSVVWQIATACVADAETDDPAFNTASTVTDAAKGTTNQLNDASITGVTATGCAAGELMHVKVLRDAAHASDDLAATARLVGVELTLRRAM